VLDLLSRARRLDLIIRFVALCIRILFLGITFYLLLQLGAALEVPVAVTLLVHLFVATLLLGPGEMLSRSFAIQNAESFAFTSAPGIRLIRALVGPPLGLVFRLLKMFSSRLGMTRMVPYLTVEEMIAVVEAGEEEREIEEERERMFHSIFDLGVTTVREVMLPRVDMVAIEQLESISEALEKITECGHSRIPVYEESMDKIVGVLYAKDILRVARAAEWDRPVRELMREAFFVPHGKTVGDLLREFREEKVHLAIVVDEYGGTAGIVTLEDVIEEIVGEIQDEFDPDDLVFDRLDEATALVNAKIPIDDLNQQFTINIPADRHDTLGGYLYDLNDRVPSEGEVLVKNDIEFTVEKVDRQRIDRVRIRKRPPAADDLSE
jgi:CBS domain containing-hemolysin-like protein